MQSSTTIQAKIAVLGFGLALFGIGLNVWSRWPVLGPVLAVLGAALCLVFGSWWAWNWYYSEPAPEAASAAAAVLRRFDELSINFDKTPQHDLGVNRPDTTYRTDATWNEKFDRFDEDLGRLELAAAGVPDPEYAKYLEACRELRDVLSRPVKSPRGKGYYLALSDSGVIKRLAALVKRDRDTKSITVLHAWWERQRHKLDSYDKAAIEQVQRASRALLDEFKTITKKSDATRSHDLRLEIQEAASRLTLRYPNIYRETKRLMSCFPWHGVGEEISEQEFYAWGVEPATRSLEALLLACEDALKGHR